MTNPKTILSAVTLAALVAASFSSVANAEPGPRGDAPMKFDFAAADANGDGKVTQEEIAAQRAARIAAMDTDKDGNISEAEFVAAREARKAEAEAARLKEMMARKDADKDGVVSLAEMAPDAEHGVEMFKRMDADGDGAISQAEADAASKKMEERRGKGKRGGKHEGKRGGEGKRKD